MGKRPNNVQVNTHNDEEFDDRIFRIVLGVVGLISVVMAIMMMVAGAIGLWALINWTLSLLV